MSFKLGVLGCREYLKGGTHSSQGLSLSLTILMKETFTDLSDISWRYECKYRSRNDKTRRKSLHNIHHNH